MYNILYYQSNLAVTHFLAVGSSYSSEFVIIPNMYIKMSTTNDAIYYHYTFVCRNVFYLLGSCFISINTDKEIKHVFSDILFSFNLRFESETDARKKLDSWRAT